MKNIVVFGAGKSSTCLIDYLTRVCSEKNWTLIIGDANAAALKGKLGDFPHVQAVQTDVQQPQQRRALIQKADIVISLLPPSLHILIARDCVALGKDLLTASYVDSEIRQLHDQIKEKKLLFLCEMGLDPGIDHMSAMEAINRIQLEGGSISLFRSHTGGLVAPESDTNPWHYKISWNPANVVRAGSSGAVFKENHEIKKISYENLFLETGVIEIAPLGNYAWYPNRDSLAYIPIYGLEKAKTFIRTTLRHPDYCAAWGQIVRAGLTNDSKIISPTINTPAEWSKAILPAVNQTNRILFEQLGLFSDQPLPVTGVTSAMILQTLMEKNWKMLEDDRDMILMLHEIGYELKGRPHLLKSGLMVKGENAVRTAMAKTVGLPLGIAAKLILENKIQLKGLHIPIVPEIYTPVLSELGDEGIRFHEEIS